MPVSAVAPGQARPGGEDSNNDRGINDGGDDLQSAAAVWAVFDVDIEDPFEQACATQSL